MADVDQREAPLVATDDSIECAEDRALMLQGLDGIDLDRRAVFILHERRVPDTRDRRGARRTPFHGLLAPARGP